MSSEAPGSSLNLRVRDDWMPLGLSANGHLVDSPLVLVGYGITAAELQYDDYSSASAAGKIAVAFSGTPDGDNPHGQFGRYEGVRWKAIAARNAGARALIVIAREDNFKEDRLSQLLYDNTVGDAGLPVLGISRQAAARLLGANYLAALAEKENKIRKKISSQATTGEGVAVRTSSNVSEASNATVKLSVEVVRREVAASNVIGILNGSDPSLKNEATVIGAHYDHLGTGGEGSLRNGKAMSITVPTITLQALQACSSWRVPFPPSSQNQDERSFSRLSVEKKKVFSVPITTSIIRWCHSQTRSR